MMNFQIQDILKSLRDLKRRKTEINTKNTIVIPDDVKKVLDTFRF